MTTNMKNYELILSNPIRLTIARKTFPSIVLNCILGAVILFLIIPLLIFFLVIIPSGSGISFAFVVTYAFSLFTPIYLLRLYLWNKFGKEIFIIEHDSLTHYYDYKYFKEGGKEYKFKRIEVFFLTKKDKLYSISQQYNHKERLSPICFLLDDDLLQSKIELPIFNIIHIGERLKKI